MDFNISKTIPNKQTFFLIDGVDNKILLFDNPIIIGKYFSDIHTKLSADISSIPLPINTPIFYSDKEKCIDSINLNKEQLIDYFNYTTRNNKKEENEEVLENNESLENIHEKFKYELIPTYDDFGNRTMIKLIIVLVILVCNISAAHIWNIYNYENTSDRTIYYILILVVLIIFFILNNNYNSTKLNNFNIVELLSILLIPYIQMRYGKRIRKTQHTNDWYLLSLALSYVFFFIINPPFISSAIKWPGHYRIGTMLLSAYIFINLAILLGAFAALIPLSKNAGSLFLVLNIVCFFMVVPLAIKKTYYIQH